MIIHENIDFGDPARSLGEQMDTNDEIVNIFPVQKFGTNSTMFTECCQIAIDDSDCVCPSCHKKVIGWDAKSGHERRMIRWSNATRYWKR